MSKKAVTQSKPAPVQPAKTVAPTKSAVKEAPKSSGIKGAFDAASFAKNGIT